MKLWKVCCVMLAVICLSSAVVSAAPAVISPGAVGNTSGLIVITNPPSDKAATFDHSYIISGYGQQGAWVTVYYMQNGVYTKSSYSWQIGASGMFFKSIELRRGENALLCYAEKNQANQMVPLKITYLGRGFAEAMNGISVNPNSVAW